MSVHGFTPTIEWSCVREIIALVRKGPSELTVAEKCEVGQHAAWFWGCSLAWYAQRDEAPDGDDSLLAKLLALFTARATFGDCPEAEMDTEELCCAAEEAIDSFDSEGYESVPVFQILSIVVPIVLELLRRIDR